jgi:hypothetical protein
MLKDKIMPEAYIYIYIHPGKLLFNKAKNE